MNRACAAGCMQLLGRTGGRRERLLYDNFRHLPGYVLEFLVKYLTNLAHANLGGEVKQTRYAYPVCAPKFLALTLHPWTFTLSLLPPAFRRT